MSRFRGNPRSFAKARETYDMLEEMQKQEARLQFTRIPLL